MAYVIGQGFGSLIAIFFLSRLMLWILKKVGDNKRRIFIAHGATFGIAVVLGGFGLAYDESPRFLYATTLYGPSVLLWLAIDLLGLKGRRAKALSAS